MLAAGRLLDIAKAVVGSEADDPIGVASGRGVTCALGDAVRPGPVGEELTEVMGDGVSGPAASKLAIPASMVAAYNRVDQGEMGCIE